MYGIPGTKNIHRAYDEFTIIKKINGKTIYLGRGKTLIIALMKRDWCEANNWKPYPIQRYCIRQTPYGTWNLTKKKRINGTSKAIYSANFSTYNEAKKEAELFEKYDWDLEAVCNNSEEVEEYGEQFLTSIVYGSTFQTRVRNDYYMAKRSEII
ncbi:MAG: hypothetical protein K6A34_06270 [Methanobrevibacter sp.]|nr:hypothetical protein [Methanobrevibacter sp.]